MLTAKFQGRPLIELPENIPRAGFLEGEFGEAALEEYSRLVRADYKDLNVLKVLRYQDGVVTGSNSFAVVLMNNKVLSQLNLRTATQADLERILRVNALDLRKTYEDTGLVLRSEEEPNKYLARNLAQQIKHRTGIKKINIPYVVWLKDLTLAIARDSEQGLVFKLKDNTEIIPAEILSKDGKFYSKDIDKKTGLARKYSEEGDRHYYTAQGGLRRLCLGGGSGSGDLGLAGSDGSGRVVSVADAVAAPKNLLDRYLSELKAGQEKEIKEINSRYEKARQVLRG